MISTLFWFSFLDMEWLPLMIMAWRRLLRRADGITLLQVYVLLIQENSVSSKSILSRLICPHRLPLLLWKYNALPRVLWWDNTSQNISKDGCRVRWVAVHHRRVRGDQGAGDHIPPHGPCPQWALHAILPDSPADPGQHCFRSLMGTLPQWVNIKVLGKPKAFGPTYNFGSGLSIWKV